MAYTHPNADPDGGYPTSDDLVKQDADTLHKHAEITSDPSRHAAAHQLLQERQKNGQQAVATSGRMLHKKVKNGLKKAFPKDNGTSGKTPFQKAADGE